jgi:hypothetical protein
MGSMPAPFVKFGTAAAEQTKIRAAKKTAPLHCASYSHASGVGCDGQLVHALVPPGPDP